MYLDENAQVDPETRLVINNAFHTHHPFKGAGLGDMASQFQAITALPDEPFRPCCEALARLVDKVEESGCVSCHAKSLAYLALVAWERDEELFEKARQRYRQFITARDWGRDYAGEVACTVEIEDTRPLEVLRGG